MRHLGVVDEAGSVIGALSARDLLRLRAGEAVALGDEIEEAQDVHDLARAWAKLPQVAASLLVEVVSTRDVAAVISRELGALTRPRSSRKRACAIRGKVTHYVPMRGLAGIEALGMVRKTILTL